MQINQSGKGEKVLQAEGAAFGEVGLVRKKLDVSELGKGQCDQDMMSEQTNKWTVGRDVAAVGDRARS